MNPISAGLSADEDHGRTSEEEEGVGEPSFDRQVTNGVHARGKKSQYDERVTLRELSIIIRAPLLTFKRPSAEYLVASHGEKADCRQCSC